MAETWITLTTEKARAAMAAGEWDQFADGALTAGGADPVVQGVRVITAAVRGAVQASGKNTLGPAGTVPPELEGEALMLLLENLSTRIPNSGIVWDEVRKNRLSEAKSILTEVREGKYRVTTPEAESGTAGDSGGYGGEDYVDFSGL